MCNPELGEILQQQHGIVCNVGYQILSLSSITANLVVPVLTKQAVNKPTSCIFECLNPGGFMRCVDLM